MVSHDDLPIPDELLRLAYLAVLVDRTLEENPFLDRLVELPNLQSQEEMKEVVSREAAPVFPDAHSIQDYVKKTREKLQLLSLPFLTEEVEQEIRELQLWSDSLGAETFNQLCHQASLPDHLRTPSVRESADFYFILFNLNNQIIIMKSIF